MRGIKYKQFLMSECACVLIFMCVVIVVHNAVKIATLSFWSKKSATKD